MFVRARALDVVVAVDGSADQATINWPNGSSPIFSSQRMANILQASHQPFPPIPTTPEQFLSTGVNQRPTFFGCYPTKNNPPEFPLVIYFPNSPPISGEDPVSKYVLVLCHDDSLQHSYRCLRSAAPGRSSYRTLQSIRSCSWTRCTTTPSAASRTDPRRRTLTLASAFNAPRWTVRG
jgi:hypothetical protein